MPRMTVPQFMLGFVLGVVGYPFSLTLTASIFTKVVGDINPVQKVCSKVTILNPPPAGLLAGIVCHIRQHGQGCWSSPGYRGLPGVRHLRHDRAGHRGPGNDHRQPPARSLTNCVQGLAMLLTMVSFRSLVPPLARENTGGEKS